MTTEPTAPTPAGTFSKPVLVAGVLGGLVGAVLSFALGRWMPAPPAVPPPAPPSEARQFAEAVFDLLKAGKHDAFMDQLRPAFAEATDEQFAEVRKRMYETREGNAKRYGGGGEFEYCRESALGSALVNVTFLERHPRGCVVWSLVVYRAADGWKVLACNGLAPGQAFAAAP
jgi:hypothetical protein